RPHFDDGTTDVNPHGTVFGHTHRILAVPPAKLDPLDVVFHCVRFFAAELPQPIIHLLFRHFVLTAPRGNTHPACPILIHSFLPHQPALMTRHRRQPPTSVLERLSLGVTTPGRCGLFAAYAAGRQRRPRRPRSQRRRHITLPARRTAVREARNGPVLLLKVS